jgi:ABC-type Na+ efflux pump permease subunit
VLDVFSFFFIIEVATLPTAIASCSLVGGKVQRSLEPLLVTPVTDGEILLGKILSALLPTAAAIFAGAAIFLASMDQETYAKLGHLYFPNWSKEIILLIVTPLASMLCVEADFIVSSRMGDVRAVQRACGVLVLPFLGIYLASEIGYLSLDMRNLLSVSSILLAVDVILFYVNRVTFRREEILTRWK